MRNPETKWKTPSLLVAMKLDPCKPIRRHGSPPQECMSLTQCHAIKKRDLQVSGFYHRSEGLVCTSREPALPWRLTREPTSVLPVLELRWVPQPSSLEQGWREKSVIRDAIPPLLSNTEWGDKKTQLSVPPRERNVELIHCRPASSRVCPEAWLNFNQSWSSNGFTVAKQSGGEGMAAWASCCHDSPSWITTEYPLTKNTVAWFSLGRQEVVKAPRISVCADPWALFSV